MEKPVRARHTAEFKTAATRLVAGGERPSAVARNLRVPIETPTNWVHRRMMERGYVIRPMTAFRYPNWIRVTLSSPEIMDGFFDALVGAAELGR